MSARRTSKPSLPKTAARRPKEKAARGSATDAAIRRAVADDPDTFIPDKSWWSEARVVMPERKTLVSLRIDDDVLTWFRQRGRGYQTRINAVLRSFMLAHDEDDRTADR